MRQVIILAAGKGSRLSKYTKNVPKALLPIKYGQTILERMLRQLQNNGVQEIVIVIGYQSDNSIKIIEWPQLIETNVTNRLELHLSYANNENERKLIFKGLGKWKTFSLDEL